MYDVSLLLSILIIIIFRPLPRIVFILDLSVLRSFSLPLASISVSTYFSVDGLKLWATLIWRFTYKLFSLLLLIINILLKLSNVILQSETEASHLIYTKDTIEAQQNLVHLGVYIIRAKSTWTDVCYDDSH